MEFINHLAHIVVETKEESVRRFCSSLSEDDLRHLTKGVMITDKPSTQDLMRLHDVMSDDCGYIRFFDKERKRTIYVADTVVGNSEAFLVDKNIRCVFNVIRPQNLHVSYHHMTPNERRWVLQNLKYVAVQMLDTNGNVVLCCNHGRSRSPMYLVVYMILFHELSVNVAMDIVKTSLEQSRSMELDRYNTLQPAATAIYYNE